MLTTPAIASANPTSQRVARSTRGTSARTRVPVAGEGRVHVDRVRHDGRAEHGRREQHGAGAVEPRDQAGQHAARVGRHDEQPGQEPDGDDREQPDDHELEPGLPVAVLGEQQEQRHDADDQPAQRQRQRRTAG